MSDINAPDPELAADLLALATQAAARAAAFLVEGGPVERSFRRRVLGPTS